MQGRVQQWPDNSRQDWSESLILLEILGQIQLTNQLLFDLLKQFQPVPARVPASLHFVVKK